MRGHREGQAHVHPGRVVLDRRLDEGSDAGEVDDLVELLVDLRLLHAEERPAQIHVFAPRELGVKAGADLEQRRHASPDLRPPFGRVRDAGEDLEQRALARAVQANDPEDLAMGNIERYIPERPEMGLPRGTPREWRPESSFSSRETSARAHRRRFAPFDGRRRLR